MPNLYKIEIFDREYRYISMGVMQNPPIQMDYLTLEATTISVNKIQANKGDFAHITDFSGKVIYQGIIQDVYNTNSGVSIKILPMLSLLDVQVQYDKIIFRQKPLEDVIEQIIKETYITNSDKLQNIKGLIVKRLTRTQDTQLDIRSNVHAFWDIITKALTLYGIIIEMELKAQEKQIVVSIAKKEEKIVLEAELENCIHRSFVTTDEYGTLNKVTFVNKDDPKEEKITYYLHPDGKIDTQNTNRIVPVFFSAEYIQGAENFEEEARNRAKEQLLPEKYQQNIELGYLEGDRMIDSENIKIGILADIHYKDKIYQSIMTGYSNNNGVKILIFGCIRLELTKKLILERRKKV